MNKLKTWLRRWWDQPGNRRYLKYVLTHKYWVWHYGRTLGVSRWQLLIHDWSKFTPLEWRAYRDTFSTGVAWEARDPELVARFNYAWNRHVARNPHHWQHWLVFNNLEAPIVLKMPDRYFWEMLADWMGAQRALNGEVDLAAWYRQNGHAFAFHPDTQKDLEAFLFA